MTDHYEIVSNWSESRRNLFLCSFLSVALHIPIYNLRLCLYHSLEQQLFLVDILNCPGLSQGVVGSAG